MICIKCQNQIPDGKRFCTRCGADQTARPANESGNQDALVGCTIGEKYHIEDKLGAGGMGTVYRATRRLIGDAVAIKILHPELVADPQAVERFRREAQATARLKHPNAVTIYDFGVSDEGLVYLVMELAAGQSLRSLIKQQGPLTPTATVEVINQVCAALDEAHRQNIVHRDVKSDNIIVATTANGLSVKVLDFGIAKLRGLSAAAGNLTQTGSVMGTPHYMSPEQCLGEELDGRSDIYSLGIVLYEMLAGVVPFNSPTTTAVIVQQVNQAPPPLRVINVSISPTVEAVVLHALEKRREARPQTAGALAQELTAAVSGVAVAQTAASMSAQAALSSPAYGAAAPGLAPTMQIATPPQAGVAARPVPSRGKLVPLLVAVAVLVALAAGTFVWLRRPGVGKLETKPEVGKIQVKEEKGTNPAPISPTPPPSLAQVQSVGGDPLKPIPSEPAPKIEPTPGAIPKHPSKPEAPRSASMVDLIVNSIPPDCSISLDGKTMGITSGDGLLNLSLKVGQHILTAHKKGYRDEQRTIVLPPGQSQVVKINLSPLSGSLTITPSVAGAQIEVGGAGNYKDRVAGLELAPGRYPVKVSKPGYRTATREVEVKPAEPLNLDVVLELMSAEELLSQARTSFSKRQYNEVIADCLNVLATQPNQPQANLLLGLSYYGARKYSDSVPYIVKAVKLGEPVTFQVKHHHRGGPFGLSDDLCSGKITLRKNILDFRPDGGDHGFSSVPFTKIYELAYEPRNQERLHLKVGIPNGKKEDKPQYNFYAYEAGLRQTNPNNPNSGSVVDCSRCPPMMQVLYELLRQLR